LFRDSGGCGNVRINLHIIARITM